MSREAKQGGENLGQQLADFLNENKFAVPTVFEVASRFLLSAVVIHGKFSETLVTVTNEHWNRLLYLVFDIRLLENVQKRFIFTAFRKIYRDSYQPNYTARLKIFDLESLEYSMFNLARPFFIELCLAFPTSHDQKYFSLHLPIVDMHVIFSLPMMLQYKSCFVYLSGGICFPPISLVHPHPFLQLLSCG